MSVSPISERRTTLASKLRRSALLWRRHAVFAVVWALWVGGCIALHFLSKGWVFDDQLQSVVLFYGLGSLTGGFGASLISHALCSSPKQTVRFSFHFIVLSVLTISFVMLIFVLQYRLYFSQWHENFPSITWAFQAFFTGLGSVFLFILTGLRPLLPWGLLGLLVASFAFSRGWPALRR